MGRVVAHAADQLDQARVKIGNRQAIGGFGALQRSVFSTSGQEVEFSLRYYDVDYANGFGKGIAAAKVLGGLSGSFPNIDYAYTCIPTYPSGQIGFVL